MGNKQRKHGLAIRIVTDNSKRFTIRTCPKESHKWEHPMGCEVTCRPEPFANICWNIYYKDQQQ